MASMRKTIVMLGALCLSLGAVLLLSQQGPAQASAGQTYYSYLPIIAKAPPLPTPIPTPIPVPTSTPAPFVDPSYIWPVFGADWKLEWFGMLPCEESSGSSVVIVEAWGKDCTPIDGLHVTVRSRSSGLELYGVTGEKAPGITEIPLSRDGWDIWISDGTSDIGMNMREDLDNDPNCPNRFGNHFSFRATFSNNQ